jgi:signal transduction histidine kinase
MRSNLQRGSVTIHVKPITDKSINISVTDTGIGIAKDKQAAILKLFKEELLENMVVQD